MRKLLYSIATGDFELNGQPIGNYLEIQAISRQHIRILHSLEHNPSYSEIVAWSNNFGPYKVHRLSTVMDMEHGVFVVVHDRLRWEPNREHRTSDD